MAKVEYSEGTWRKSSYSGGGNDCVEVALFTGHVGVRDSKNPDAGALSVSPSGWRGLLHAVGRN
ncbi:DUF397 domain-containing protein [Amycolatopsis pithecellobii]|uniref:DUF397 domain-containing protein n=1 Tax=Amycolatopsis pithecellobii TaxID=664692 RepID=A0A6N7Z3H9_9PSEU|nr:DUF397 domain-containing protein [Amycolatopsis pithecellobii]MTD53486.1 DUF397 domain-containing protein [Amycolatopsis pithecellobii]